MKKILYICLTLFFLSFESFAQEQTTPDSWASLPSQPIDSRFNQNFDYKHDKGFYFSLGIGPQWNQSLKNPAAGAFRFGGKASIGFLPVENLALHANVWGNFLEEASLVAVGPGVTYFFGDSDIALGAAVGIGWVFSTPLTSDQKFRETVLATELSLGKYWWVDTDLSFGVSAVTGVSGITLSNASLSNVSWHTGLRAELVFN